MQSENRNFRILIVDDVPKNIQVLGGILLKKEYNITFASNGKEAIEIATSSELDLILLDVMMPEIDGFETCRILKSHGMTKDIPVIFMSALSETLDKLEGFKAGAVDYITKPYEAEEVLARVNTHLTIRSLQKNLDDKIKELEITNQFIRKTFGQYLSDEVVHNLLDSQEVKIKSEKREVTILMSDLRGYSVLADKYPPEEIVKIISRYIEIMTDIIFSYEGIIDEIIGDALMVIFGAPVWKEDHASRAVACAIEMQKAMVKFNEQNKMSGYPELEMGIGINTGEVVVGTIGSIKRAKYGVVGKNVNLTSRIESYTLGNQVLISESTFKSSENLQTDNIFQILPKGVNETITVYSITGIGEPYNLFLNYYYDDLININEISVRYSVIDENYMLQNAEVGIILKLSPSRAIMKCRAEIPLFSNMKLELIHGSLNYTMYSKVIKTFPGEAAVEIHFTAVPEELKSYLKEIIQSY